MIGLFQEHGPCFIRNDSSGVDRNPHSWNEAANMYNRLYLRPHRSHWQIFSLYIDQPIGVGFSYGSATVSTSLDAAKAVWNVSRFLLILGLVLIFLLSSYKFSSPTRTLVNTPRANLHFGLNRITLPITLTCIYLPQCCRYGGHYGPIFASYVDLCYFLRMYLTCLQLLPGPKRSYLGR
jgi:hypothetical protein